MWSGTDRFCVYSNRQSPIYSLVSVIFGPNSTKEKFDSTLGGVMSYYPGLVRREKKNFFVIKIQALSVENWSSLKLMN